MSKTQSTSRRVIICVLAGFGAACAASAASFPGVPAGINAGCSTLFWLAAVCLAMRGR